MLLTITVRFSLLYIDFDMYRSFHQELCLLSIIHVTDRNLKLTVLLVNLINNLPHYHIINCTYRVTK